MPAIDIPYKGRTLRPRRATIAPDFASETVLVSDPWEYVDLWLKRNSHHEARAFWSQAREFAEAAAQLPVTSAPLPAYYSFLNATKALLKVRKHSVAESHGVHGQALPDRRSLDSEQIHFHASGVLSGLCAVLNESTAAATYSLKAALYNLPFIHRAYCLTFTSAPELFIPLKNCRFVRKARSDEAWFCAEVEARYSTSHLVAKLPNEFELDDGATQSGTVRMKSRFKWNGRALAASTGRLLNYHQKVRRHVKYVFGPSRLWYLKRNQVGALWLDRSSLTLSFAIMHRLSELSRYQPLLLRQHLDRQHNWLLSEFVATASRQFIDQVASEITGSDFMIPGIRR